MTTYTDKNGNFRFRKASKVIVNITGGYLSNKQNVKYKSSSTGFLEDSGDNSEDENLESFEQFTTILLKLSDKYSQKDQIYVGSFHIDVIDICQANELPLLLAPVGRSIEEGDLGWMS